MQVNTCKVNDLQTHISEEIWKNKTTRLSEMCNRLDSSLIALCKVILLLKIKRVHLIVRNWASAIVVHPPDDRSEEFGWAFSNDTEDTEPSIKNVIEGIYNAICS